MKDIVDIISKRRVFTVTLISILLILGIVIGFSFSYFITDDSMNKNNATTDCFKMSYNDSNDINLEKAYPISEAEGSTLTPYTFTIKNLCNNNMMYEIDLETLNSSSLSTDYIRIKLNTDNSSILSQKEAITEYANSNISEGRKIDNGSLSANEEKTFNLRMWLDENSTVSQSENKTYKGKIVVKYSSR